MNNYRKYPLINILNVKKKKYYYSILIIGYKN